MRVGTLMSEHDGQDLDALLLVAFLEGWLSDVPPLTGPEPELDPADQRALDALGPDLIRRLLQEDLDAPSPAEPDF